MNNYFNFNIPYFNQEYGEDWDNFKSIIDDNVDYLMEKTFHLYWLNDPNLWTEKITETQLDLYKIPYNSDDTFLTKKAKFYTGITRFKNKGLASIYIDAAADIVGVDGDIYSGSETSSWIWGESFWGDATTPFNAGEMAWGASVSQFYIYFDVKTTDSGELDEIELVLEDDMLLPAFYQMFLIDSSFTILRTINQ